MSHLTVTAKGQVTLKKDLLKHLGLKPGEKIDAVLLPNGRVELKSAKPSGSIGGFIGLLKGKSQRALTVEDMNRIAAEGWTGLHEDRG